MKTTVNLNLTVGTLDAGAAALLERIVHGPLIQATGAEPSLIGIELPGVPAPRDGERYAGIAFSDGKPSHHLFLLDAKPKRMTWADAKAWAEGLGAALPERFEAALLYANLRDQFDADSYHWTATQYSAGSAWIQYFTSGNQGYYDKDLEFLARAVRRLEI